MLLNGKRVELHLLKQEATAAGVGVGDLGTVGMDENGVPAELITWDEDGTTVDVPPEMAPVVAAHVAPLPVVEYVEEREVAAVTRTTDGTMQELYRVPTATKHVYDLAVVMRAVDAGNGAVKVNRVELTFKRGTTAAVQQVGSLSVIAARADAGTTAWAIQAQPQGTDLVIGVRGEAGRTIDWHLEGRLSIFSPAGISP